MTTLLRPNTVAIDRRSSTSPSQTGARQPQVTHLNTNVPALIDLGATGQIQYFVGGLQENQDSELFLDGLQPYQFIGVPPLGTIVVNGVTYTVAANSLGAFPDLAANDRITDERGNTYLVLAVQLFYNIIPTVEAKLSSSRAWGG